MIAFTVIGIITVAVGVPFLALNLWMMRRDNRELRQRRAQAVPEEYSALPPRQLNPHVPKQWHRPLTDEDLGDIKPE